MQNDRRNPWGFLRILNRGESLKNGGPSDNRDFFLFPIAWFAGNTPGMEPLKLFSFPEDPDAPPLENKWGAMQEAALLHKMLHGLLCEWQWALDYLSPTHQKAMKPPLFSIKDMASRLGTWSKDKQEIALSRNLVLNHPWDAVREVLFHEMAHQMADQVFQCVHESPHGPGFQNACRLLRANPAASGNYPTLDQRLANNADTVADRHLRRIKKLMALAGSQNRHEAQAAMIKAHVLIQKYNIDTVRVDASREFVSVFLGKPELRHTRDHYRLAVLLRDFYFVQVMWVPAFAVEKNKMGRVLEVTGTPANIQIAAHVYHFVRGFIRSQWEIYNAQKGHNQHRKIDFSDGIMQGFREKLDLETNSHGKTARSRDLVKGEDPLLNKHMAYKYPRVRTFSRNAGSINAGIVNDGIDIGKKLIIAKGISSRKNSNRLLPG